jgi:hypothetical protein
MRFSPALERLPFNRLAPVRTPTRFGVAWFVIRNETAGSQAACSEITQ